MVKTEASHAFNIGSNPVRVTSSLSMIQCTKTRERVSHRYHRWSLLIETRFVGLSIEKERRKGLTSEGKGAIFSKWLERKRFDIKDGEEPSTRVGVDCGEGPPVPIPNTEVKLICADDTCRVTGRENR